MSRINTNVSSLLAQRVLGTQNRSLTTSLERLSTGLAINRGADNPAGLIASENLRSEKAAITAAIDNAQRADQVMNIAEGGLQEINSMLLQLQSLVGQTANAAGLSTEEKKASQLQVDSILQTIDRIAQSTSFQGTKLLNGSYDFTISGQAATVSDFQINAAKLGNGETQDVKVIVTASAQHAGLFLSANGVNALDLTDADARFVIDVAGAKGSRQFTFGSGTTLAVVASNINKFTSVTGVSAKASGTGVVFKSDQYGSDQYVSVKVAAGAGGQVGELFQLEATDENAADTVAASIDITTMNNALRDEGQDVGAIINGIAATSDGSTASINTDFLDLSIDLTAAGASTLGTISAFTITGGGAKFNLGPKVDITNQVSVGIGNVAVRYLGTVADGFLDALASGKNANLVSGDPETAQQIVDAAIGQVSSLRGRLGAFQKNTVGATINSLNIALENTSAAESAIRDTDFASETASLTRAQILVSAATNVLALANSQPQNVLRLLQG